MFSISRIKELVCADIHTCTHISRDKENACKTSAHIHRHTGKKGEVRAGVCVCHMLSESSVIDCVCDVSVSAAASLLQLTYAVFQFNS